MKSAGDELPLRHHFFNTSWPRERCCRVARRNGTRDDACADCASCRDAARRWNPGNHTLPPGRVEREGSNRRLDAPVEHCASRQVLCKVPPSTHLQRIRQSPAFTRRLEEPAEPGPGGSDGDRFSRKISEGQYYRECLVRVWHRRYDSVDWAPLVRQDGRTVPSRISAVRSSLFAEADAQLDVIAESQDRSVSA